MFGHGKEQRVVDAELGPLLRVRNAWRGHVRIDPFGPTPLSVPGSRSAPDDDALTLALTANDAFEHVAPSIDAELAEHRSAYEADDTVAVAVPPGYVAVIRLDPRLVLEFGYRVPWDEEHTLGARVSEGKLIELNGSVLEP